MIVKLSEKKFLGIVRLILEQEENEWVDLTPNEYLEYMKYTDFDGNAVSKLKQFRDKKIRINGSLNLRGTKTASLGNVKYINGDLDISNTDIGSTEGLEVKGKIFNYNSKQYRIEQKRLKQRKIADMNQRREDGEWDDISLDDTAQKAKAILDYLVSYEDVDVKTEEDIELLKSLNETLKDLENRKSELDDEGLDTDEIEDQIDEIEDKIEELNKKIDIYNIYYDGEHYYMDKFFVLDTEHPEENEYAVGNESDMDRSMEDYFDTLVDEGISNMFSRDYLEDFIDEDIIEDYARDYYSQDVYDSPEVYLNDDDKNLSQTQEDEIDNLNNQIIELRKKQSETEDLEEYDEIEDEVDDLIYEIDEIKENPDGDYDENKIEEKIEEFIDSAKSDPINFLRDLGYENSIEDFIDINELRRQYISDEGYGVLNGYDGDYTEIDVNGETFYVMRVS